MISSDKFFKTLDSAGWEINKGMSTAVPAHEAASLFVDASPGTATTASLTMRFRSFGSIGFSTSLRRYHATNQ
jgi:hypothetical protein